MIAVFLLLASLTIASLPESTEGLFGNMRVVNSNSKLDRRLERLERRWEKEEDKFEKQQEKKEKRREKNLEREEKEREKELEREEKEWEKKLEREEKKRENKLEREETRREKELERDERRREKELEKEERKREKEYNYEMKKLSLTLKGPTDCTRIENFEEKEMYPKIRQNHKGITVNGHRVRKETKYKTYECTDPPRYPFTFYKLVTVVTLKTKGGESTNVGTSSDVKYYYDESDEWEEFNWKPDMKKYQERKEKRNPKNKLHKRKPEK